VTGASSGIGFQIAEDFLRAGAVVGAHYRRNEAGVRKLVEGAEPGHCEIFQADFTQSKEVLRLWKEFINWSRGIDVLVNNAGEATVPQPMDELDEEAWDSTFQVNVKAPWLLSRASLSLMTQQRAGRIINISSIGVKFGGGITTVHYSASKAALEALTNSFAKAGATSNVLVNTVRAGVTDTAFHEKIGRTDLYSRAELIPLQRLAQPSEISAAVLFLASDQSSYITGTTLTVAGGE
jgi:3-oxoacyl-[acyl-carrier protein] reductase